MEIIKEYNYDWMWKVGLIILVIGILLFLTFLICDVIWCSIGVPILIMGIIFLISGIIQLHNGHSFRVKINDTYMARDLLEKCNYVRYEEDYGTWIVRFKKEDN